MSFARPPRCSMTALHHRQPFAPLHTGSPLCCAPSSDSPTPPLSDRRPLHLHIGKHRPSSRLLPAPSTGSLRHSCGLPPASPFGRRAPPSRIRPGEFPSLPLPKMVPRPHRLSPRPASQPPHAAGHRIHSPPPLCTMPSTSPVSVWDSQARWLLGPGQIRPRVNSVLF
jgi:hypothetical protein